MTERAIRPGSHNQNFPHGQFEDGEAHPVYFCKDSEHMENVVQAFPDPGAMYVLASANVAGRRYTRAVVFWDDDRVTAAQERWIDEQVRTRMIPDAVDEVYVV